MSSRVHLSLLDEGSVFEMENKKCLVTNRIPADRSSGGTQFVTEDGQSGELWWDWNDPIVTHLGTGKIGIIMEKEV